MRQRPIILVTGATGAQGGSVANALLKENKFAVRALTRNSNSARAKELAKAGAEIVVGTLDDIESLKRAMKGCYGVFGVTNYWEHFETEYFHGKNLIEAVHQSGIKHFVFSTSRSYNKLSNGAFPVACCDIKNELQEYTKRLSIPATFIHVALYYENFLNSFAPHMGDDGHYFFGFPQGHTNLSMVSVEDIGGMVTSIFDYPDEYIGRIAGIVGEDRRCAEYASIMSKVLGRTILYKHIPRDEYAAYNICGAEDVANMFEVQRLYVPNRKTELLETYGLNPATQSFECWLKKNKEKFEVFFIKEEGVMAA
ncbi:MAG: NmrA/HSCARG family protein [Ferruginibacter sp.]